MKLISLTCIAIFFCITNVNAFTKKSDAYANLESLMSMARNISNMFGNVKLNSIPTLADIDGGRTKLGDALLLISRQMELYDQPLIDLSYLYDGDSDALIQTLSTFEILKNIDREYQSFKRVALILKGDSEAVERINASAVKKWSDQTSESIVSIRDIFDEVEKKSELIRKIRCKDRVPLNFLKFRIYLALVSSQLKMYAISVLDWHRRYLDAEISEGNSIKEILALLTTVEERLKLIHKNMETNWDSNPKMSIKNCDAKKLERDVNFIELERAFQLIVVPENDFMFDKSCDGQCESMRGQTWGKKNSNGVYSTLCEGYIRDCVTGPNVLYCNASVAGNTPRRYQWVASYEKGKNIISKPEKVYGNQRGCRTINGSSFLDSGGSDCDFCLCTCEETTYYSKRSTFIISSQLVTADVMNNMVVTGIRFVKRDRIVYTEIKEGKLLPGGRIDKTTDNWKAYQALDRTEVDAQIENHMATGNNTFYENFIVINESLNLVNLNQLRCPQDGGVVTGVGLKVSVSTNKIPVVALVIRCHPVDYKKGEILASEGPSSVEDNFIPRIGKSIGGLPPDRCEREEILSQDSYENYRIQFQISDLDEDAGQSVIPWFDAQDVMIETSMPLSGIELYHRGTSESGGFLAYGLIPMDYSRLI